MAVVNGHTRTCGLMGNPVEHTLSPVIHNTLADLMGENLVYVPFHVEDGYIGDAVKGAYGLNLLGMNVTVPYKSDVISHLQAIDSKAAQIGAVNTLVRMEGGYKGYNTDNPGLYRAMCADGVKIEGEKVLILGAGGVARAVAMLMVQNRAAQVIILNRTVERAQKIADEVNAITEQNIVEVMALEDYSKLPADEKYLAIQATSVGMHPNVEDVVIADEAFYQRIHTGYDLIFNPWETRFMKLVKEQGGNAYNGAKMLLYQGIIAYELWTGKAVSEAHAEFVFGKMKQAMGVLFEMKRKKNVVLIGFMGCGKTTVGLKLSYRLRMPVEDTDKFIEQREGRSISNIFAQDGEAYFRTLETKTLEKFRDRAYTRIISVGGGTPVNPVNREIMKQCGTVVYLRVKPETVYERLKGDTTRPLLQCEDPLAKIRTLLEARKEAYEDAADIIIDVDDKDMEKILEELTAQLLPAKERKKRKMKLLVINGPNLNFLGIREKSVYGNQDYKYLLDMIANKAKESGNDITVFQSNHEGAIIDRIQEAYFDGTEGIVINPGAYTHYSYAIRDALASITVPKVEIHISDITKREEFRKVSVTAPVCDKQIYGQGLNGYLQAIDFILEKK